MRSTYLALALLGAAASLGAVALSDEASYPGLRAAKGPLRITWTLDKPTVKQLGGSEGFEDQMASVVFKRLSNGDVPMKDGVFDPLKDAFVNLDIWTRGVSKPEDPKDPDRVFHFQFQVFAPASCLRGKAKEGGRILVWERSEYGVVPAEAVQQRFRDFLKLCDDFSADWRASHPIGEGEDEGTLQESGSKSSSFGISGTAGTP